MIEVYFEYGTPSELSMSSELVATFETEEMYMVCFESLKSKARELGAGVSETILNEKT
jgi:hypothetical protein